MIGHAKHRDRFTRIDNATLEDRDLSFGARGLLALLLSKPADWDIDLRWLEGQSPGGKHVVRQLMNELVKFGYASRNGDRRQTSGKLGHAIAGVQERPRPIIGTGPDQGQCPADAKESTSEPAEPGPNIGTGADQGKGHEPAGHNQGRFSTVENQPQATTDVATTEQATTRHARFAELREVLATERSMLPWVAHSGHSAAKIKNATRKALNGPLADAFDAHLNATEGQDDKTIVRSFMRAQGWLEDDKPSGYYGPASYRYSVGGLESTYDRGTFWRSCQECYGPDPDCLGCGGTGKVEDRNEYAKAVDL